MIYKSTTILVAFLLLVLLFMPKALHTVSSASGTSVLISAPLFSLSPGTPEIRKDIIFSPEVSRVSFPSISAEAVLVADIDDNSLWYQRASTETVPIASLTKMMTALLFEESTNLSDLYSVTEKVKQAPSKASKVPVGSWVFGQDILKLMMIESDNDIALLAAEKMGRLENFKNKSTLSFENAITTSVSAMNGKAYDLGMYNTFFANPIGLDDALLYSTAHDVFILMKYLWTNHPDIWEYSRHTEDAVSVYPTEDSTKSSRLAITNTDPLLAKYPRILGSKTGTTDGAKEAVVFIYQPKSGKHIAVILLKSDDRFGEAEKIIHWLDAQ